MSALMNIVREKVFRLDSLEVVGKQENIINKSLRTHAYARKGIIIPLKKNP